MLCHVNKPQLILLISNSLFLMHKIGANQRSVCNLWRKTCIRRNTLTVVFTEQRPSNIVHWIQNFSILIRACSLRTLNAIFYS
jgi:hypothetical protein